MLGKRRACLNGLGLHHVYFNSLSGFQTRLKPPTRTQHRFRKCVCGGGGWGWADSSNLDKQKLK